MRLRTKYAVVLLVVTVVLSAGVYGGLELYKAELVGQTQAEVNETATLTAEQISTVVRERKDFVGFVASRPRAARFGESEAYLADLIGNSRYFAGQVVAANGTIVGFHGDVTGAIQQEAIGRDVGDRPYVREALAGEVYVSELEFSNATGRYVAIISAPIFDDREIVGVLAVASFVDERTFFPMLGPIERSDQTVVVRDGERRLYGDEPPPNAITSTVAVEETGWTVQISRDRGDLNAQLQTLALAQVLGLSAVLLAVIGFAAWEYRTTLRQAERLLDGFEALAAGDYDHNLSLVAAQEWEQISDGFNALASTLATRERQLRGSKQRLQVLNRVLRHNLRNTAAVMLGYGDIISDRSDDADVTDAADAIFESIQELMDLGDKARQVEIALDKSESAQVPTDVVPIVEDVVESARADHPSASFEVDVPPAAWVVANEALEIVIENVVENACEHNDDPDPLVEVSVTAAGPSAERVAISVADNGPGIPAQEREVLREGRETQLEHGSGMGLWLVHWALERFGGELQFEDRTDGGTVVTLVLTAAQPDAGPPAEGAPAEGPSEPDAEDEGEPTVDDVVPTPEPTD